MSIDNVGKVNFESMFSSKVKWQQMATEIAKDDSYVLSSMSSAHFEGIPSIQNCLNIDQITEE